MEMSRRETAAARRTDPVAGPGATTPNRDSLYEGRILAAQSERFEPRTDGSLATLGAGVPPTPTRPTTPGGAPALASPGLTVLAATGIMEGYRQFHLIPSAHLRLSNYAFAVIAPLVAVLLARSRRGWYRNAAQRSLLVAALLTGLATPLVLAAARSQSGLLLGAPDLAVAGCALWAVLAGERTVRWSRQDDPSTQAIG
jgi:hypothetical protein